MSEIERKQKRKVKPIVLILNILMCTIVVVLVATLIFSYNYYQKEIVNLTVENDTLYNQISNANNENTANNDLINQYKDEIEKSKAETEKWILACKEKNVEMVCLDVPLLFESGMNEMCDIVIAIVAPRESCLERIVQRDCITPLQAQARLDSQLTSEALTRMCDFVIVNDDSLEILTNRVKTVLSSFS